MDYVDRVRQRINSKTLKHGDDDCWLWIGARTAGGYPHISSVTLYGEKRTYPYGHRTVWALEHGRWPTDTEVVRHRCDNCSCVNPRHLEIGSQAQNMQERPRSGRWWGTGVGKLTPEQVRWVRGNGLAQTVTAEALGISQKSVSNIRSGKTYRSVV